MIILIIFVVAIILMIIGGIMRHFSEWLDWEIPSAIGVIVFAIAIFMGTCAFIENTTKDATIAEYQIKRESLVFQLENNYYDNVVENGRENLMKEISEFNATVVKGRINGKNVWIGVFWPEDWDAIELIDLNKYRETK